ncbi:MAG: NAD+ synthase [Planctomycetaceae bacterium]|nr:NAD+ synthase [Planctomycetaceae bacterium]
MRVALAQLNPVVGDFSGNARLIAHAADQARAAGASLLVVSELAISGYPPRDLIQRRGFVDACDLAVEHLAQQTDGQLGILVGHPTRKNLQEDRIANAASLLFDGRICETRWKVLLPNYDVFDEKRYFHSASHTTPIEFGGLRLGVHICEDAWWGEPQTFYHIPPTEQPDPVAELGRQGVDLFINLSASPFEVDKVARRHRIVRRHVARFSRPFLFVNQVGGNDDLVFDGNSFVMNAAGEVVVSLAGFETDLHVVETDALPAVALPSSRSRAAQQLDGLTLGLRDYMRKCGFKGCVLGLSGGIDSALAAAIAARAVGPENVHGLLMPSRYSSRHSVDDALKLAENLGMDYDTIPIDAVHQAYENVPVIGTDLLSDPAGLPDQNLQARIRGAMVMVRSNRHGWIALATGNKSELAVGYCTLYGDMCGGFAVLSDLYKRDVYAVSRYVNELADKEIIPEHIITKAPSAELAPDQFDQDSLPPYDILDGILERLIDQELSPDEIANEFPAETVKWVVRKLDRNEFKRRQMPPGIKLHARAFGSGRRMPMAAKGFEGLSGNS